MKRAFQFGCISMITVGLIATMNHLSVATAQTTGRTTAQATRSKGVRVNLPAPPPTPPVPGNPRGGAGRGDASKQCPETTPLLTALAPFYQGQDKTTPSRQAAAKMRVWGQTTASHPTLWFYLPYGSSSKYLAQFTFRDGKQPPYKTAVSLPATPGIVSVTLPQSVAALQPNGFYQWELQIYCDRTLQAQPTTVSGWIQRVSLPAAVQQKLQQASPLDQAALYAENGILYDALTTLGELRRSKPQDATIKQEWEALLEQLQLEDLVEQAIVP